MKIKISYCVEYNLVGGGLNLRQAFSRYYIKASTEIYDRKISASSEASETRLDFEQAKELKKQAKERLIEKVNSFIDNHNYETKMSEILSSEEVEL